VNNTDMNVLVRRALHEVAPDADLDRLAATDDLRDTLTLDSLDFLQFVELLSERTGRRIDEEDYPRLATLADTVAYLT
jgi:acyl carrier protein